MEANKDNINTKEYHQLMMRCLLSKVQDSRCLISVTFAYMIHSLLFLQCDATLANWELIAPSFPQSTEHAICGYNSNTQKIFALGGANLMSFDVGCNQINTHSSPSLSISCDSQCHTQFNNMLYFVKDYYLGSFNMDSKTIQHPLSSHTLSARGNEACLTASEDGRYLFIVGGSNSNNEIINNFQIYDTVEDTLTTGPRLGAVRCCMGQSCNVINGRLYVFGGYQRYVGNSNRIVSVDIQDITNVGSPTSSSSQLSNVRLNHETFVFNGAIYNIGGGSDIVERFDAETDTLTVENNFPVSIAYECAVSVDDRIYVMYKQNLYLAYSFGSTLEPTLFRTCNPTAHPTAETTEPTEYPTAETTEPTEYPTTAEPTFMPTRGPTSDPTVEPTVETYAPTSPPTEAPTQAPVREAKVMDETDSAEDVDPESEEVEAEDRMGIVSSMDIAMVTGALIGLEVFLCVCGLCVYVLKRYKSVVKVERDMVGEMEKQEKEGNMNSGSGEGTAAAVTGDIVLAGSGTAIDDAEPSYSKSSSDDLWDQQPTTNAGYDANEQKMESDVVRERVATAGTDAGRGCDAGTAGTDAGEC